MTEFESLLVIGKHAMHLQKQHVIGFTVCVDWNRSASR